MSNNLLNALEKVGSAFSSNPDSAVFVYETNSELTEGFQSTVSIRDHKVIVDEPQSIGGGDTGPSPIELILAGLASCQEISYKAFATKLGIPLNKVQVNLKGTVDLKGFFGIDESVRPGYQNITGTVYIESSASKEEIEKLKQTVDAHCPVLDIIANTVPVSLELG